MRFAPTARNLRKKEKKILAAPSRSKTRATFSMPRHRKKQKRGCGRCSRPDCGGCNGPPGLYPPFQTLAVAPVLTPVPVAYAPVVTGATYAPLGAVPGAYPLPAAPLQYGAPVGPAVTPAAAVVPPPPAAVAAGAAAAVVPGAPLNAPPIVPNPYAPAPSYYIPTTVTAVGAAAGPCAGPIPIATPFGTVGPWPSYGYGYGPACAAPPALCDPFTGAPIAAPVPIPAYQAMSPYGPPVPTFAVGSQTFPH